MKRGWVWIVVGLFVLGLAFGGLRMYRSSKATQAAAAEARRYVTAKVGKADVSLTVSGTGPVAAAQGVNVKPQQSGIVDKVLAHNGDKVKAGQPVVVLKNSSVMANLANSQSSLNQAQENLANALNVDPIALQQARQKLASAQNTSKAREADLANLTITSPVDGILISTSVQAGDSVNSGALVASVFDDQHAQVVLSVPQYIADAQQAGATIDVVVDGAENHQTATLSQIGPVVQAAGKSTNVPLTYTMNGPIQGLRPGAGAHATLKNAGGTDYIAYGSVGTAGVTVRSQVAGQVAALAAKPGDRVTAGATLATLTSDSLENQRTQAQSDLTVAQAQLDNLLNPTKAPGNNISQLQYKLQAAQADLTAKQEQLDQLTVRAPFDGTIGAMNVTAGDSAGNGTALFRVSDYSKMTVSISVDELDIARVKLGQTAQVTLDALPGKTFTAKVTSIDPEGVLKNDIANFGVTLTFDQVDGMLAGMNALANITVQSRKGVIAAPVSAVTRRGPAYTVRVMENGQPVAKNVKVGLYGNDLVEITEGLQEGDTIVIAEITARSGVSIPGFGGGGNFGGGGARPDQGGGNNRQGGTNGGNTRSTTGGGGRAGGN